MGTLSGIYKTAKTKIQKAIQSKPKSTAKPASKSTNKPVYLDVDKAKKTLAGTAVVGAGVGAGGTYLATKGNKSETPKKQIDATPKEAPKKFGPAFAEARKAGKKEFTWNGKKYNTELASDKKVSQESKPNESNAPSPFKKDASDNKPVVKKDDDKMEWAKNATKSAQGLLQRPTSSSDYKKGGSVKKMAKGGKVKSSASSRADGCATKGKTKGRFI